MKAMFAWGGCLATNPRNPVSNPYNSAVDTIYLDNNATTRPAPEVVAAMVTMLTEWYGNPLSLIHI